MNLIVCLDDSGGMRFNKRRQSRDSLLIKDLIEAYGQENIWANSYSSTLFEDYEINYDPSTDNLNSETYYFLECLDDLDSVENIRDFEKLVIYRWNRQYPADEAFDDTLLMGLELIDSYDFAGSSHEKITKMTYRRNL